MEPIGTRIESERKALGLTRKQLAQLSGVSYGVLGELAQGRQASTTKLHKIAEALNVSVEWLETGRGKRTAAPPVHIPTLRSAIRLLELVAEIRGVAKPGMNAEALAVAYDVIRDADDDLGAANAVEFMREFASREQQHGTRKVVDVERSTSEGTGD